MSKTYKGFVHCVAPFSSIVVMQNGIVSPCCEWQGNTVTTDHTKTLQDSFNEFKKYRKKFAKAKCNVNSVSNCMTCANASKQYLMHNRSADENINYLDTPTITNLHLKFNNFCNLACRMCDPWSSSVLAKEHDHKFNNSKNPFLQEVLIPGTPFYDSVYNVLPNLNRLWFSGGEPLIQKEVWNIIEHCVDNGYSKNIQIKFNTNGTVVLTDTQLEKLLSFQNVWMDISQDGIGELAEYIRTKLNWKNWLTNFEKYHEMHEKYKNFNIYVATALSVYNVHRVDEIYEFFKSYGIKQSFTPVWFPEDLCVKNLNDNAKKILYNKFINYPDKLKFREVFDLIKLRSESVSTKGFIESTDARAIKSGMYKNYKLYQHIEPEWFDLL